MEAILRIIKAFLPTSIFRAIQIPYHYLLALFGALIYRFPARKLTVVAVTGTKGKSSTVELLSSIFETAGYKTAHASTISFKIGKDVERNLHKMTMPGRFFLQRFLRKAITSGCTHAVIEMTSEGARQFRHKFIPLNALVFLNLAPEHIESHGSYENYLKAKLKLAEALETSPKKNKVLVVNGDDKESEKFLEKFSGEKKIFSLKDVPDALFGPAGVSLTLEGVRIESKLPGKFNLYNILSASTLAKAFGIGIVSIKDGVEKVKSIRGRAESIKIGQPFEVIVDYAHTPDSLQKIYETYAGKFRICVLGNTGGGRDTWKRPVMGKIASTHCDKIILTNEDPYDEDPEKILKEMASGITSGKFEIILDRREAIKEALKIAQRDDVVLITGKGTDPYIMGPNGTKELWDDSSVVREELKNLRN